MERDGLAMKGGMENRRAPGRGDGRGAGLAGLLRDRKKRGYLIQAAVLLAVAACALGGIYNTAVNLKKAGISSGFKFLGEVSGFDIGQTLIDYSRASTYGRAFWVGLLNTLQVSVFGILLSTVLGFLLGVLRLSGNWLVSRMAAFYIEMVRNVPLLLQILFWYIAILNPLPRPRQALSLGDAVFLCNRGLILPEVRFQPGIGWTFAALGGAILLSALLIRWARARQRETGKRFPAYSVSGALVCLLPLAALWGAGVPLEWALPRLSGFNFRGGVTVLPEFIALAVSLTLYTAAFIAENVRAGIMAVSRGQREAAAALGFRGGMAMRLVIIPQAMRVILPPLTSQHLSLVKNSSLAVVIGYPDLIHVFAGTTLNQTGQAVEIIAITMLVYLTISLFISALMNWYNKRVAIVER